ncbi:hypothetical protein CSOJ01_08924 [Colletotrichum sojae]|uniref:Uncharacterized protein n=1 Tax=Colletotrichum sojae TaxID=2175907 RepID=A0A8H6J586_9PEZI|nr:hypothetical protein CSOJ01_08924 [Colletotrichum sojae]
MKAVRLTNRRLCEAATPYVFSNVELNMSKASLGRLENISRHPVIGPLVRQIHLRLPFHHSTLATNIYKFTSHAWNIPYGELNNIEYGDSKAKTLDNIKTFRQDLENWREISRRDATKERSQALFRGDRLLQRAFVKYGEGFLEERELRQGNSFVEMAAKLVKGLPNLEQLVIVGRPWDYENLPVCSLREAEERGGGPPWALQREKKPCDLTDHDVFRLISAPMQWGDAQNLERIFLGDNTRTMLNILTMLGREGVKLRGLFINISPPWRYSNLCCSSQAERALCELTDGLEYFRLQVKNVPDMSGCEYQVWLQRELSDLGDLRTFTDSILQSRGLREIRLNLAALSAETKNATWHVNMLMTPREWPELRELSLFNITIYSSKLGLLLGQRKEKLSLTLIDRTVSYGTWREALDVMHRMAAMGGLRLHELNGGWGAEFGALSRYERGGGIRGTLFGRLQFGTHWPDLYTRGRALCYIMQIKEYGPYRVNPFDTDQLSQRLGEPFVFEPRL